MKRKGEELFVKWEDADSFLKSKTGIVEWYFASMAWYFPDSIYSKWILKVKINFKIVGSVMILKKQ